MVTHRQFIAAAPGSQPRETVRQFRELQTLLLQITEKLAELEERLEALEP